MGIPCWPFRTCFLGERPLFGCLDPEHLQKALSRCVRAAGRIVTFGNFFVNPTCLVASGVPIQAFECVNSMRHTAATGIKTNHTMCGIPDMHDMHGMSLPSLHMQRISVLMYFLLLYYEHWYTHACLISIVVVAMTGTRMRCG